MPQELEEEMSTKEMKSRTDGAMVMQVIAWQPSGSARRLETRLTMNH